MPLPDETRVYPRPGHTQTVYLKNVITRPGIEVGDFTIYNDFRNDPRAFQDNNVLYHYPMNHDRLIIGKFCSIACGAVFILNGANHTLRSLSTYPFPSSGKRGASPSAPRKHGTNGGTSSSATTCGSATKRPSCPACASATGRSSGRGPW